MAVGASPGASERCAVHRQGRHHWTRRSRDHWFYECVHCGLTATEPLPIGPRRQKDPTAKQQYRTPCPTHPSGRHAWGQSKGNGPIRCARCGIWRTDEQSAKWHRFVRACFKRDGAICFYCREPLVVQAARLDHFIPASKGGGDGLYNRRASCRSCDEAKADQMPWEFMPERFSPSAMVHPG